MKIAYDKEVDAVYIGLSRLKPEGAIELADGINIDVTIYNKTTITTPNVFWEKGMHFPSLRPLFLASLR